MFKFINKLINKKTNKRQEDTLDLLINLTGSVMGEIDRLVLSKGFDKELSGQVNAYSYFLVYTTLFMAEQKMQPNISYLDIYKKRICRDHASSPESVKHVEEYYEKSRIFYTSIFKEYSRSPEMFNKLSEMFIKVASIDQPIENEDLRSELMNSISNLTEELFQKFLETFEEIYRLEGKTSQSLGIKELASEFGKLIEETDSGIKDPFENFAFRYKLTSKLASLIDGCDSKMFNNPDACIAMNKDFEFAYLSIPKKGHIRGPYVYLDEVKHQVMIGTSTTSVIRGPYVYLDEVKPYYDSLKSLKEEGQAPDDPMVYMITDEFSKKALDIVLDRLKDSR